MAELESYEERYFEVSAKGLVSASTSAANL
jgi:hypothetical protein